MPGRPSNPISANGSSPEATSGVAPVMDIDCLSTGSPPPQGLGPHAKNEGGGLHAVTEDHPPVEEENHVFQMDTVFYDFGSRMSAPQGDYGSLARIPGSKRMSTADRTGKSRIGLQDLPEEIYQYILDILFGSLKSVSSSAPEKASGMHNWSNVMRYSRSKDLSEIALLSPRWRRMVQARLYRHSTSALNICPPRVC
jgi:hypothetical protein